MARRYPLLFQANTRVLLGERGRRRGRPATFDDLPDSLLDDVAGLGFDWLWPLGVWRTGPAAREVSRARADWREGFVRNLPDLREEDICGSPYAIQAYQVNSDFGGNAALARFRERLAKRGVSLLLDFVPNHVSPDHPWVSAHPEWFVEGTEDDLARDPQNWLRQGKRILAHGRDPNFPGWPDTVQLNYRHSGLRAAMVEELRRVAACCDGVRCDMAMLELPDVFTRTWGDRSLPKDGTAPVDTSFWPEAATAVRQEHPSFVLVAEAYWDLEWELQQQGFDFTYDKRLYDRLRSADAGSVRDHLRAEPGFRDRSIRFLENHDEPRAAATFSPDRHRAAAVITFLAPGLRFFHEGQLDGRKVHVSMHLARRPDEPPDRALQDFYGRLLAVLRRPEVHEGTWRLRECHPAWAGNPTASGFIAMSWEAPSGRILACTNLGATQGQCWVDARFAGLDHGSVELKDLMGDACYVRAGAELAGRGLYLDLPASGHHVFEVRAAVQQ